jgi:hypothetical protein
MLKVAGRVTLAVGMAAIALLPVSVNSSAQAQVYPTRTPSFRPKWSRSSGCRTSRSDSTRRRST